MRYGTLELFLEYGTLSITNRSSKITRHYPATNKSDSHDLGREATLIRCSVIIINHTERIMLEQTMNTHIERNLAIDNFFYKRVVPDREHNFSPIANLQNGSWLVALSFIALDPIPYDIATGGALI